MSSFAYLNDQFLPTDRAVLPVGDLAIQRGYGVFDYLKVSENVPLFLEDHLCRFFASAEKMELPLSHSRDELKVIIRELISRNQMGTSGIRLTLTGGVAEDGYSIAQPNLIITQSPLKDRPQEVLQRGMRLITFGYQRQLPEIKTIDYIMAIRLQKLVRERNVDDVLYMNEGCLTECPRTNFFLVTQANEVVTPDTGILEGVTRKKVLELAAAHFRVQVRPVFAEELQSAREAFITSTSKGVMPVVQVDDILIGSGKPQEISRFLDAELTSLKLRYTAESIIGG